jgi:hypothetical protein
MNIPKHLILNKWKASESRGHISGHSPSFLQQGQGHQGRGTDRGRGRRGGRGNSGRDTTIGSSSKPNNVTSDNENSYVYAPDDEIAINKKSDSDLSTTSGTSDILMNMRHSGSTIPRHWIILDSASSPDNICDEELVMDIRSSGEMHTDDNNDDDETTSSVFLVN